MRLRWLKAVWESVFLAVQGICSAEAGHEHCVPGEDGHLRTHLSVLPSEFERLSGRLERHRGGRAVRTDRHRDIHERERVLGKVQPADDLCPMLFSATRVDMKLMW